MTTNVKEIETKFHETVEVDLAKAWHFPQGLPGFEDEEEFVLLPIGDNPGFQVLQSTKEAGVAFVVANPYKLVDGYDFIVNDATIDLLEVKDPEELMVLGIVFIKEPFEESTINLQAPLLFHTENRKAKQMILNDKRYLIKHPMNANKLNELKEKLSNGKK
ncbi:flagellar assembly protein FliW [Sporosarcina sp. PTS2304]|uniref:flagellar assembly protein FliW n=1 Tax=Sporosarcina sp. PTS2304 TaxID=2283194 RepID=UPI000E0CDB35|nr:flagellar assembly protein FliW [Sporosarcina sp. PTS2304]AXH98418.1 flagellar assembly protein FliW [Sporosarcina sp. PTS2304]